MLRDLVDALDRAFSQLDLGAYAFCPEAECFEFANEVAVHLDEFARQSLAFEQVGNLWLDTFISTADRSDGRRRGDREQERVAQAVLLDVGAQALPTSGLIWLHVPKIELQLAFGRACFFEGWVRTKLLGQLTGFLQSGKVNFFLNLARNGFGFF